MMSLQGLAVAIIVPLCALYALWHLVGAAARRRVSAWLSRGPWPESLRQRLAQLNTASGSCCDGCDHAAHQAKQPGPTLVQVHRRKD